MESNQHFADGFRIRGGTFGLFLEIVGRQEVKVFQRHISFVVGMSFIFLGAFAAIYSVWQHKRVLKSIRPVEIPGGYNLGAGMFVNSVIGILGIVLSIYLAHGFI